MLMVMILVDVLSVFTNKKEIVKLCEIVVMFLYVFTFTNNKENIGLVENIKLIYPLES